MLIQKQTAIQAEQMEGEVKVENIQPERFDIFTEKEAITVTGDKVIVKELLRTSTESEIRADIANYRNSAQDFLNKALELENLLINK